MKQSRRASTLFVAESSVGSERAIARRVVMTAALIVALMATFGPVAAQSYSAMKTVPANDTSLPRALREVGFEQKLDGRLPLDAQFHDEIGRDVTLGTYFNRGRPVILAFVYYSCPMMCNEILDNLVGSLKGVPFVAGKDFDVVAVGFDPREDERPGVSAEKKRTLLASYGQAETAPGWHFLTGNSESIKQATGAAGFKYHWDEATDQFAHPSGIIIATPDGRLARYFYGIEYAPREIKLGLVESSEGRIGSPVDAVMLYCYHYDPSSGKYTAVMMNILRVVAVGFLFAAALGYLLLRTRRRVGVSGRQIGEAKGAA